MSSFYYQKPHPLRRSGATVTEVIFIMSNLFEKLLQVVSVKETQFGSLRSAAEAGGMLEGAAGSQGLQRGSGCTRAPKLAAGGNVQRPASKVRPAGSSQGGLPSYLGTPAISGQKSY